ncbi:MAG: hypothetical protein Kow00108_11550 [Calditrichia bacterium]
MNAMFEKVTKIMNDLGFTVYEAKAYISLLKNNPVTRYELSKNSGVPRSAIYDVIRRLENIGAVNALTTSPEKYIPLPPEKLIEQLENQYKQKLNELKDNLEDYEMDVEFGHLWNIIGYKNLIMKARELIHNAEKEIYVSCWTREIKELEEDLKRAEERGLRIVLFSFTEVPEIGFTYSYNLEEEKLEKIWDHKLIIVRDREELVMGEADKNQPKRAAWTENKAILSIALNHIVLDITLYGLRFNKDVSDAVLEMHPGEMEILGKLMLEKYPELSKKSSFNFNLLEDSK